MKSYKDLVMIRYDRKDESLPIVRRKDFSLVGPDGAAPMLPDVRLCPIDPHEWIVYRTGHKVSRHRFKISHLHAPIQASQINWGCTTLGQIYDYAIVGRPINEVSKLFELRKIA